MGGTLPNRRTPGSASIRVLTGPAPWRALVYGASGMLLAVPTVVFLPLFPLLPPWAWALCAVERRRVKLLAFAPIDGPPAELRVPPWRNATARLVSTLGWRELAASLVHLLFGILTFTLWVIGLTVAAVAILAPFRAAAGHAFDIGDWRVGATGTVAIAAVGLIILLVFLYLQYLLAVAQAMTTRALIGPRIEELEKQVATLAGERVTLIDAFETERRRIERDLHDGPQQHLAGAALHLGLLRTRLLAGGAEERAGLLPDIDAAQDEIERALDAIRTAVAGLRPRTLLEKGLFAALTDLGPRCPIPMNIHASSDLRLEESAESSIFSMVTEFVANSLKYSGATGITITLTAVPEGVLLVMSDDGCGGAEESRGTGLLGMRHRATLLDGDFDMSSPPGGPTTITVLLPSNTIRTGASA